MAYWEVQGVRGWEYTSCERSVTTLQIKLKSLKIVEGLFQGKDGGRGGEKSGRESVARGNR